MKNIQDIFSRIQERRKKARVIRKQYKDALYASHEYQRIVEDLERLRALKKQHEQSIQQQANISAEEMDMLKLSIRQDAELLSDIALTSIMKGEPVSVKDEDAEYEPVFKVHFRKAR